MTGSRPDTWMPLYCGDYLRDTMHLLAREHGAYFLLIMHCWMRGGEMPADDRQLAAVARCSAKEWPAVKALVAPFFVEENGVWRQGRVSEELARATGISTARQKAGKIGGKAKANNLANGKQKPRPSPSQLEGSDPKKEGSAELPFAPPPPIDLKAAVFRQGLDWLASATSKAPDALRALLGKWCRDHGNGHVIDALAAAQREAPVEPIAWIEAKLAGKRNGGRPPQNPITPLGVGG